MILRQLVRSSVLRSDRRSSHVPERCVLRFRWRKFPDTYAAVTVTGRVSGASDEVVEDQAYAQLWRRRLVGVDRACTLSRPGNDG